MRDSLVNSQPELHLFPMYCAISFSTNVPPTLRRQNYKFNEDWSVRNRTDLGKCYAGYPTLFIEKLYTTNWRESACACGPHSCKLLSLVFWLDFPCSFCLLFFLLINSCCWVLLLNLVASSCCLILLLLPIGLLFNPVACSCCCLVV